MKGLWACVALVAGMALSAAAAAVSLPGPVVDAAWLHAHLDGVTVVDVRADDSFTAPPRFAYDEARGQARLLEVGGHIPGAHLVRFADLRVERTIDRVTTRFMLPDAFQFQSLMRAAGVDGDKPIVIASRGDEIHELSSAARLYWTLKTYGSSNVAVLNGGVAAWLQAGHPVSTAANELMPGDWTARDEDRTWFAGIDAVRAAAKSRTTLVDARPLAQFLGLAKVDVLDSYGHIDGAQSLATEAVVRQDGLALHYLDAPAYGLVLRELGIPARGPVVTYCNTAHLAAGAWFVLSEIVGNPDVRLYDGSLLQWLEAGETLVPAALN